jgi:hypothetical protein
VNECGLVAKRTSHHKKKTTMLTMMQTLLLVSFLATATSQLADKPDFSGPGIVTCLAKDYLAAPCRASDLNTF